MGIYNRPYWKDGASEGEHGGAQGMSFGLPRPGPVVKWLLILNVAVFLIQVFVDRPQPGPMSRLFGVTVGAWWQAWRYITFQFLHGGGWHLALNMLGLYMLGTALERHWGNRRFLWFYLTCGITAGVAYVLIGAAYNLPPWLPIIGASGGVFGILLACAVLFPHFRLLFFFFLIPIRLAAIIIFGVMGLTVMQAIADGTAAAMSDVAHLGGVVAAAVWIWVLPKIRVRPSEALPDIKRGAWERRMRDIEQEQREVDRILQKIHDQGIQSLTRKERTFLADATKRQQQRDKQVNRL